MTEPRKLDPRLPAIEGGWEQQLGRYARLWVPKQPDALFDPDAQVERREYHAAMPYWAWVWDAADPCVEGLLRHGLAGRGVEGRVLEVGAGLGAVGIALAATLGERVTCTLSDYDPLAIQAMYVNAELNGLEETRVWALDWRDLNRAPEERFDVIIGCEVIYDSTSHAALLDVFERYLERESGRALIFDPGRAPARQFARRARQRGFSVLVQDQDGARAELLPGEARWLVIQISADF